MDCESNESVCNKFDMSSEDKGVRYEVVVMVERSTVRLLGHLEKMDE